MATTNSTSARKALLEYAVYVPLGTVKLAADKARELSEKAWTFARDRRGRVSEAYGDLAERGKKLATSIRNSAYTKRAVEQAKTARTQVKKAAGSVRNATDATAEATREAVKKVG
ncbi:MAG: hypothetical protein ABR518_09775 [Actinomycetota bacterium]